MAATVPRLAPTAPACATLPPSGAPTTAAQSTGSCTQPEVVESSCAYTLRLPPCRAPAQDATISPTATPMAHLEPGSKILRKPIPPPYLALATLLASQPEQAVAAASRRHAHLLPQEGPHACLAALCRDRGRPRRLCDVSSTLDEDGGRPRGDPRRRATE